MSHAEKKAAIDCTRWRKGVNFETHRVIAGLVTDDAMEDLISLKAKIEGRDIANQADWDAYVKNNYDFEHDDDDNDNN